jgi:hypothetical protein
VSLFRRRKPLHERLLEEGGLGEPLRHVDVTPPAGRGREAGVHGMAREREWDAVATVAAPDLRGNEVHFDVLPDRTVLVEEAEDDQPLTPLAEAVERELAPPYRARGVRQSGELWAVAARSIALVRLPEEDADTIELSVRGGERELRVDDVRQFGTIRALEELAAGRHDHFVVRAERLDGDWWEVRVDPL